MAAGREASHHPEAKAGLELVESPDGLVVYDPSTDRVHHLNQTAAVILELCDGTQTPTEIATTVGRLFGIEGVPDGAVAACLEQLAGEQLIS